MAPLPLRRYGKSMIKPPKKTGGKSTDPKGGREKNRKPQTIDIQRFAVICLAFPPGFEPGAFRLGGGRSILLSYGNIFNLEWCSVA